MSTIYTKLTNMNVYFMKAGFTEVSTLNRTFPETFSPFSCFQTKSWGEIPETIIKIHSVFDCSWCELKINTFIEFCYNIKKVIYLYIKNKTPIQDGCHSTHLKKNTKQT